MAEEGNTRAAPPAPTPANLLCTLDPILTAGPDSLDTLGHPAIKQVKLLKLQYVKDSTFHEVITKEADDLFASVAKEVPNASLVPPTARPTAATFAFHLAGSSETPTVELRPPDKVAFHCPTDALAIILAWLANSPFNAAKKIAHFALVLLLALTAAAAPALDDDDDSDDDDDPTDERAFSPI